MTNINYDQIANKYDDVREAEVELINLFLEEVNFTEDSRILDFGCGTGNYTNKLQRLTQSQICGVDPSAGMIAEAKQENGNITFKQGNHEQIPFPDNHFDFIYMTDVVHHVPDLDKMFNELERVLKIKGKICIVTESQVQIENRCIVDYFPTTAKADKERYPTVEKIITKAQERKFSHLHNDVIKEGEEVVIDEKFLELVANKGYSMLQLISEEKYKKGLQQVKADLEVENVIKVNSGNTLIWLQKNQTIKDDQNLAATVEVLFIWSS